MIEVRDATMAHDGLGVIMSPAKTSFRGRRNGRTCSISGARHRGLEAESTL